MKYIDNPKFADAQLAFRMACLMSRLHLDFCKQFIERFGGHGPLVSGVCRDHFPQDAKDILRQLATAVTMYSDRGHAARPKHYSSAAMVHLAREVATRHGSGFYGPQPFRK